MTCRRPRLSWTPIPRPQWPLGRIAAVELLLSNPPPRSLLAMTIFRAQSLLAGVAAAAAAMQLKYSSHRMVWHLPNRQTGNNRRRKTARNRPKCGMEGAAASAIKNPQRWPQAKPIQTIIKAGIPCALLWVSASSFVILMHIHRCSTTM